MYDIDDASNIRFFADASYFPSFNFSTFKSLNKSRNTIKMAKVNKNTFMPNKKLISIYNPLL